MARWAVTVTFTAATPEDAKCQRDLLALSVTTDGTLNDVTVSDPVGLPSELAPTSHVDYVDTSVF